MKTNMSWEIDMALIIKFYGKRDETFLDRKQ